MSQRTGADDAFYEPPRQQPTGFTLSFAARAHTARAEAAAKLSPDERKIADHIIEKMTEGAALVHAAALADGCTPAEASKLAALFIADFAKDARAEADANLHRRGG